MTKNKTTKKMATRRTTAKKVAKPSKPLAAKAGGDPAAAGRQFAAAAAASHLAALHVLLDSAAKTPDQRADAAIVGLAQQHLENGDHETVGSLLGKVGTWAGDKISIFTRITKTS
jgi:hypothetical protein